MPRLLKEDEIEAFRDQLCNAAETLYEKKGVEGVTMRELAQALNVSAMTPYRYFSNKQEILGCLQSRVLQMFCQYMTETTGKMSPPMNFCACAANKARAYIRFREDYPQRYKLMFENFSDREALDDELRSAKRKAVSILNMQNETHDPETSEESHIEFSHIVWAALHGMTTLKDAGIAGQDVDMERYSKVISQVLAWGYLSDMQAAEIPEPANTSVSSQSRRSDTAEVTGTEN